MSVPESFLTPSEQVFLNGEKFAQKGGLFGKVRLMHIDLEVNVTQLAQMAVAAAFLINEQTGTLRLELRQKKGLLGLGSVQALYAEPCGSLRQWPPYTLEADVPALAERFRAQNKHEVYGIVYAWLGADSASPFNEVIDRIKNGLADRMLLGQQETKRLKVFTVRTYTLPDTTRSLAQSQPLGPVQQLFQQCEQTRPQVWKALLEQIKKAVAAHQEKADTDFDD
jgi:hypothetical protein